MNKKLLLLPLFVVSSIALSSCSCANNHTSSESIIDNTSTVDSSSAAKESSSNISIDSSSSKTDESQLNALKNTALSEIDYTFNDLDAEAYSKVAWNRLLNSLTEGKINISKASTAEEIETIKQSTISYLSSVKTIDKALLGTPFQHKSGDYDLDVSNDGVVSIYYNGWPGRWSYVGNTNYNNTSCEKLEHNLATENIYKMKVKNSGKEKMFLQLKLSNDNDYSVDTGIITLEPNETRDLELSLAQTVSYLYLFVDSCLVETYYPQHNHAGQLDILSYGFDYVDSDAPTYMGNKASIMPNEKIDLNKSFTYALAKVKDYTKIGKIKVVLGIDFNGADASHCYWGGIVTCGSTTGDFTSAGYVDNVDTNNDNVNESTTQTFYIEPKDVTSISSVNIKLTHWGGTYDVVVQEVSFIYDTGLEKTTETVEVNKEIYGSTGSSTVSIPYSSFIKKGKVDKVIVNMTVTNNKTYKGGSIYMGGIQYSAKNVANIGYIQEAGKTKTGDIVLYPSEDVDLTNENGEFTITSWWAPASSIIVNSITVVTDIEVQPVAPTSVVAHAGNSQISLEWEQAEGATSYDVYCNGVLRGNVTSNYMIIDNLENGQEYSFYVISKNSVGTSEASETVKGTPDASAKYDQTLDGLNSNLETMIGSTGIKTMKNASIISKNNNYRLKKAFEKMRSGADSKVAFIGGSVTVGEVTQKRTSEGYPKGYAAYTADYIKDKFGTGDNIQYINAGISGTGSELGITRVDKDVLSHNPDIIFIEYAVNNSNSDFDKQSYESLVRKCLTSENAPAVVLVFSGNDYSGHEVEEYMTQIGNHYDLPMFSMDKALKSVCTLDGNNNLTTNDPIFNSFIKDGTHPNDDGHKLYGKLLSNFLTEIDNDEIDATFSVKADSCISNKYESLIMIDNTNTSVNNGSWTSTNTLSDPISHSHVTAYQNGWAKSASDENEALSVTVEAKNFIVVYKNSNPDNAINPGTIVIKYTNVNDASDTGTIEWDLTLNYKTKTGKGWDNPVSILVFDKDVSATYTVEITLKDAQTNGTIYAMGYSK